MRRVNEVYVPRYTYTYTKHLCTLPCAAFTGSHEMLWKNLGVGTLVVRGEDEWLELGYTGNR